MMSILIAATFLAAAAGLPARALPAGGAAAADVITPGVIAAPIRFLASDLLEGRAPSHRGGRLARVYLASELEALGLSPGGDGGGWDQHFPIVAMSTQVPATWRFTTGKSTIELSSWSEFIAASGVQAERAAVHDAELVFVGYGIVAPEYDWDDFKGADLKGKVLLFINNDPDWDPVLFAGKRRLYYGRWDYKYAEAARQGAAGAIIIHTTPSAGYPWQVVQDSWTGEQFELPARDGPRLQVKAWTTEAATRKLLAAAGYDLDVLTEEAHQRSFRPVSLGVRTSLTLVSELHDAETANVLGVLKGSDPALAGQAVVVSAHFDHLGVGTPDEHGDRIYNGARDNAAGCAQVLAIARAFAALVPRPRRSVVFAFFSGEESGLLGSQWYADHPTVPAGRLAACINFDGGNIFGRTHDVALIGDGKSSMDDVARAAAALQGRIVTGETEPDKAGFYRSDQLSLAKIGVPALYFTTGQDFIGRPPGWGKQQTDAWLASHYHRPSDQVTPDWRFDGMVDDARLGFFAALMVADADAMPTWRPGDEFAAARRRAIAAASAP
jgi:Zn-dependent M28 family amino/carboxypeptidase